MELCQVHSMVPLDPARVDAELRAAVRSEWLDPRGGLSVASWGPWRPVDLWPEASERMIWSLAFESRADSFLSLSGEEAASARATIARRHAPVTAAELVGQRMDSALVIQFSDAAKLAYVAIYRERALRWSLSLEDHVRSVRCDGRQVILEEPPGDLAEVDRSGVLHAGLQNWLREDLPVPPEERIFLADQLGTLFDEATRRRVVWAGRWEGEVEAPLRRRVGR